MDEGDRAQGMEAGADRTERKKGRRGSLIDLMGGVTAASAGAKSAQQEPTAGPVPSPRDAGKAFGTEIQPPSDHWRDDWLVDSGPG